MVWAKKSLVANKIESKSYYSRLILHSVRVEQKICVWIHKNKRFVETVLLSTHETLHIKKYTLNPESNVAAASKSKNSVFASSANMSKLLLLLRWFLAKMRRLWNRQTVPYYFRCWWRPWRDMFPCGSTHPFLLHFWKVCICPSSEKFA